MNRILLVLICGLSFFMCAESAFSQPKWCDELKKNFVAAQENYDNLRAAELKAANLPSSNDSTQEIIAKMNGSPSHDLAQKRSQEALIKLQEASQKWGRVKIRCATDRRMSYKNKPAPTFGARTSKFKRKPISYESIEGEYKSPDGVKLNFKPSPDKGDEFKWHGEVEWQKVGSGEKTRIYKYKQYYNLITITLNPSKIEMLEMEVHKDESLRYTKVFRKGFP